jgi:hypothetical protein
LILELINDTPLIKNKNKNDTPLLRQEVVFRENLKLLVFDYLILVLRLLVTPAWLGILSATLLEMDICGFSALIAGYELFFLNCLKSMRSRVISSMKYDIVLSLFLMVFHWVDLLLYTLCDLKLSEFYVIVLMYIVLISTCLRIMVF